MKKKVGIDSVKDTGGLKDAPVNSEFNLTSEFLEGIKQYVISLSENDKYLYAYVILKLKLVPGKCLILTQSIERSFRLKLFLEQFGIIATVLDPTQPLLSRVRAIEEFNFGIVQYIISPGIAEIEATIDQKHEHDIGLIRAKYAKENPGASVNEDSGNDSDFSGFNSDAENSKSQSRKSKGSRKKANEENEIEKLKLEQADLLINFDMPHSAKEYTRRIGFLRSEPSDPSTCLLFMVPKSAENEFPITPRPSNGALEQENLLKQFNKVLSSILEGSELKDFTFDKKVIEGFRYRSEDVLKPLTKGIVKSERQNAIRKQLVESDKLKEYFKLHTEDADALLRNKYSTKNLDHLKDVPAYLAPKTAKSRVTKRSFDLMTPYSEKDKRQKRPQQNQFRMAKNYIRRKWL